MRIMFVITDLKVGGSPRMLRDLAIGLKRSGDFLPVVVSLKPLPKKGEGMVEELKAGGVKAWSLDLESARQLPAGVPRLLKFIVAFQPEVVVSILIHANALATITMPFVPAGTKPKFAQSMHTLQDRPAWHWILEGILAKYADAVVAPSAAILQKIEHHGSFERGVVIPNGIDVQRFADAQPFAPQEVPWPSGSRVVGYVGRFDPVKNLPLLLRAFAQMAQSTDHLAMVGYGSDEERLRNLAASLHIAPRVHFVGPTQQPGRWYKSFTCHCLPSTVEGFGLTLVEAMAAGIPVVAIRTPVTAGIVREGIDGILVDRPDRFLLAKALQSVMDEISAAPQASTSPPKTVEIGAKYVEQRFSVAHMVELYGKFLKNF